MTDKELSAFAKAYAKNSGMTEDEYRKEMARRSSKNKPENRYFAQNPAAAKLANQKRWKRKLGEEASG